jgi:hypothetical protein
MRAILTHYILNTLLQYKPKLQAHTCGRLKKINYLNFDKNRIFETVFFYFWQNTDFSEKKTIIWEIKSF